MPTIICNNQPIFYTRQTGQAGKPTLLLIHGAGGRHTDWPAKVRFLPKSTVYALDLPGHAQSPGMGRDTIEAYTDDVAAFIDLLGLSEVCLVGHSMGGAIAQSLALRGHQAVTSLILVATSARLRVGSVILDNILTDFPKAIATIIHYSWATNAHPMKIGFAKRLLAETNPAVLYGDFIACNQFDVTNRVGEIEVPTLVISGSADQMTPAKFGQRLAAAIPNAHFEVITGGGHFLGQEYPDKLAALIQTFVNQQT